VQHHAMNVSRLLTRLLSLLSVFVCSRACGQVWLGSYDASTGLLPSQSGWASTPTIPVGCSIGGGSLAMVGNSSSQYWTLQLPSSYDFTSTAGIVIELDAEVESAGYVSFRTNWRTGFYVNSVDMNGRHAYLGISRDQVRTSTGYNLESSLSSPVIPIGGNPRYITYQLQVVSSQITSSVDGSPVSSIPVGGAGTVPAPTRNVITWGLEFYGGAQNVHIRRVRWGVACAQPAASPTPAAVTACLGRPLSINVAATGGSLQYQWRKNQQNINGATSATLMIPAAQASDAGGYDCIVFNSCGTTTTSVTNVSVKAPDILTQPSGQSLSPGQPVSFAVELNPATACNGTRAFQWQRRDPLVADESAPTAWVDVRDGNGIVGAGGPSLSILRPNQGLATGYRCRISGACGCEANAQWVLFTETVNFSVACPADFNADGGVDYMDIESFFEHWEAGC